MRPTKRDELVEKALAIFYQNGFHATGMDRLVADTGISKTSMYKHFRTKEDLILAALTLRDKLFRDWLVQRIEEAAATPRERILALFDVLGEWFASADFRGCMFIKASAEFQNHNHPVRQQSAEHKQLIQKYIQKLAEQAGLPQPVNLARQIIILKEGAIVATHVSGSKTAASDAKEAAEQLLSSPRS
ncbi:TetR/AcrR family transcriptional regulator [uncultured Roseovarius sp.]|uniref:TetR/AcrR family transcriptional regulator n=1 Tax=uncultured Roseovarius sp. TaxID=293344 RepID=UPI00261391DC|nr:TetR/AcrR family transcriptional regulator [uncultured Roseovarius sp.]